MPRDGGPARLRLQQAALELYEQHGFDQVTIAEIAARADVTERTFYRHFADKREVLFDGERVLREALVAGIEAAPADLEPLPVLLWAFRSVVPFLVSNRPLSEPNRRVILATPALRERAQAKTASLIEALSTALRGRGVSESASSLAAQLAMAASAQATTVWFVHPERDLDELVLAAFADLRTLTAPLAEDTDSRQR